MRTVRAIILHGVICESPGHRGAANRKIIPPGAYRAAVPTLVGRPSDSCKGRSAFGISVNLCPAARHAAVAQRMKLGNVNGPRRRCRNWPRFDPQ